MFRIKLRLTSAIAALAALIVCGIATSAASAAPPFVLTEKECKGGTSINFCYEKEKTGKLFVFSGEEEFELLHEPLTSEIVFKAKLGGEAVEIGCLLADAQHGGGKEDGLILQPKPLEADFTVEFELLFLECTLKGKLGEKCKVPVERVTRKLVGNTEEKSDEFGLFKPKEGAIFIEIPFEGEKCPVTIKGNRNVTGELLCFLNEPLVDAEEHLGICNPEKGGQAGKLFFGSSENEATFLIDDNVFLLGTTDLWSVSNEA
jgi:hypothetical protein